jgi:hypothetical protein
VLIFSIVVGMGANALHDFADLSAAASLVSTILGVSFAGFILLGRVRCEIRVGDGQLVFRSRPVFGFLLNWPWTERRIPRRSIDAFTLDQNPWTEQTLTIRLDDGSSLRVLESGASAGSDFQSFVTAFRSFLRAAPGSNAEERINAWRFPILPALVGGVVVACGVSTALAVRGVTDQPSAFVVVMGGIMVGVAGVRFLLKHV